jgi:hypothetical protein
MTICISAIAESKYIVSASDTMISVEVGADNSVTKMGRFPDEWGGRTGRGRRTKSPMSSRLAANSLAPNLPEAHSAHDSGKGDRSGVRVSYDHLRGNWGQIGTTSGCSGRGASAARRCPNLSSLLISPLTAYDRVACLTLTLAGMRATDVVSPPAISEQRARSDPPRTTRRSTRRR